MCKLNAIELAADNMMMWLVIDVTGHEGNVMCPDITGLRQRHNTIDVSCQQHHVTTIDVLVSAVVLLHALNSLVCTSSGNTLHIQDVAEKIYPDESL